MNLNQVTLPATDVARSVQFYRDVGFTQIVSNLPYYARFECSEGEATFSLHKVDSVVPDSGVVVYFECQDLDATCSALAERGIKFDSLPTDQSWLWREAYLRDPDGNVLLSCWSEPAAPTLAPAVICGVARTRVLDMHNVVFASFDDHEAAKPLENCRILRFASHGVSRKP